MGITPGLIVPATSTFNYLFPPGAPGGITPQMLTGAAIDAKLYSLGGKWLYEWFFDSPIDTSTLKLNQDVFEKGVKSIVRRLPSPWGIAGGVIGGYGLIRATENVARRLFPDFFE